MVRAERALEGGEGEHPRVKELGGVAEGRVDARDNGAALLRGEGLELGEGEKRGYREVVLREVSGEALVELEWRMVAYGGLFSTEEEWKRVGAGESEREATG